MAEETVLPAPNLPAEPQPWKLDPQRAQTLFSDPKFLRGAAELAVKHNQPNAMQWLERAHVAAKEGAFEAVASLMRDDIPGAVQAFNKSGRMTDVESAVKNQDGTYTLTRKGGRQHTLDPMKEYEALLTPQAFFEHRRRQEEFAERGKDRDADRKLRERQLTLMEGNAQAAQEHRNSLLDLRERELGMRETIARLRGEFAESVAMLRGGGRSGSGSGGGGAAGGGFGGWKTMLKDIRDEAKEAFPEAGPEREQFVVDTVARATAHITTAGGRHYLSAASPSGQFSAITEFNSEDEARKALQAFIRGAPLPKQGFMKRDNVSGFDVPMGESRPIADPRRAAAAPSAAQGGAGLATNFSMPRPQPAPSKGDMPAGPDPRVAELERLIRAEGAKGNRADMAKIMQWTEARKRLLNGAE